jgi:hypothetical protein
MNETITLNLTIKEVEMVLNAMAFRPYNEVGNMVNKIRAISEQQMKEKSEALKQEPKVESVKKDSK